jgi:3'(2'), 5'-bisphosphate nucleotidase
VIDHALVDHPMPEDTRLAADLAVEAGRVLLDLRAQVDAGTMSGQPSDLKGAGDEAAQRFIAAALASARPDDAILSEEATDDPRRLTAERVWIVDPLDGTTEFAERSTDGTWRDDFAVHLALWQRERGLTDAAVALPGRDRVHTSGDPTTLNGSDAQDVLEGRRPLRVAVSRSRPPAIADRLTSCAAVRLVPMGSAGVKAMAVVEGAVDAYVHAGGQYEWDSAAPVAVARAAGIVATRLDGSALVFNQADPWSPDLLICRPELAAYLDRLLTEAGLDAVPDAPGGETAGR